jgi:hypothetical protein
MFTFVPIAAADTLRTALFEVGAGTVGQYTECSFSVAGTGTFKAGLTAKPFAGQIGLQHQEAEMKIEMIFPTYLQTKMVAALKAAHPYEEVAYDIVHLTNTHPEIGSGMLAELPNALSESEILEQIKTIFKVPVIRHSALLKQPIKKVALCGGAGSFLITNALEAGAQLFITADVKYHQFFDANQQMLIVDIGHYESEQFTMQFLLDNLREKFPTFASLKTTVQTNAVHYFL